MAIPSSETAAILTEPFPLRLQRFLASARDLLEATWLAVLDFGGAVDGSRA